MKRSYAFHVMSLIFSFVLFSILSIGNAQEKPDRWRLTGFTKHRDGLFVDMSRVNFTSPDIACVWVRISPSAKSKYRDSINHYLEIINKPGRGFKTIEIQCDLDCSKNRIRFLKFAYFDKIGNMFHEADQDAPAWLSIPPGNLWGTVTKEVCPKH